MANPSTDLDDATARPTFAFYCGLLSLAEFNAFLRAMELLETPAVWVQVVYAAAITLAFLDIFATQEGTGGWFAICVVFGWNLLDHLRRSGSSWRPICGEWMLVENDFLVYDGGLCARFGDNERAFGWKEVSVVAETAKGILFADWKQWPIAWIPERALLPRGSRRSLIAVAVKQRVRTIELSTSSFL